MNVAEKAPRRTLDLGQGSEHPAAPAPKLQVAKAGHRPPRPRLTLNVGITGHRATVLPAGASELLGPVVEDVFRKLRNGAMRLHSVEAALFDAAEPQLRLHTPLATGADQVAADGARANGYTIRALLPFAPEDYAQDFQGHELDEFRDQLAKASSIFALPGDRSDDEAAYVMVGKAVVAAADILVAIWDGGAGNGPGGTAHVVDLALENSVPVIHIEVDRATSRIGGVRLLVGGDAIEPVAVPLEGDEAYSNLLRDTLAPHTTVERKHIADFFAEREKRTNWRFEYPLLLSILRIKSLPRKPWRQSSIQEDIAYDMQEVRDPGSPGAYIPLTRAYGWANFFAIRYAQLFRSGHVTNYALSALAVIIALSGLIVPSLKVFLVLLELGTIGLLFLNTSSGTSGEWHRRWLQYRHLAESLRPLIYLKRTGMISTPFRSDFIRGPLHREAGADWTRWYAAAVWREMDSPSGIMTKERVREMADDMIREQILPQSKYHHVNAHRMRHLDHRLHEVGNLLMGAVIAACVLFLIGYVTMKDVVKKLTEPFVVLTAGVPALSAAIFGMRGHGEHLVAASRSANTAAALEANAARLREATKLETLSVELEHTASIMLADLDEWTVSYRERSLEIPA